MSCCRPFEFKDAYDNAKSVDELYQINAAVNSFICNKRADIHHRMDIISDKLKRESNPISYIEFRAIISEYQWLLDMLRDNSNYIDDQCFNKNLKRLGKEKSEIKEEK